MSTYYKIKLRVGFEVSEMDTAAPLLRHYEHQEWDDPNQMQKLLSSKLGCNVDYRVDITNEFNSSFIFYLHDSGEEESGYKFDTGLKELPYQEVFDMKDDLAALRDDMLCLGIQVGDAKVFIAQDAS